ncbi:histidine kinase [Hyunsoonleella sp. SJ7]|uniref:Histidine kinase n=1 Tax=Hyunsoonleella aquatilis TaxID=2762758 RepID=A0A923HDC9_9FLAO|nr:histidine kinase [Hyunsoonleella aquatilis]MBC3759867.1 histidine kinase [Hyunsoonleella aquatilis]
MVTKFNTSDRILLVIYYSVFVLLMTVTYHSKNDLYSVFIADTFSSIFISLIIIVVFFNVLIPKYLFKKRYFYFIVFGVLILSFFGALLETIVFFAQGYSWSELPKWHKLAILGISTASDNTGFLFGLLLTKKFYENQTLLLTVEKQQKENELKSLRSQIDPHFLFNNLNTLDCLIDGNPDKAKEYTNRLSLIYRYLIKTKDAEVMELAEEIELAENYIFLIKTRFENDYDFKVDVNTTIEDKFIPTGAIQTLLENVVKHNKPRNNEAIKATILVEDNALKVINTKSSIPSKNESFGTGLDNLKARYQLLSDKKIVIINTDKKYTISIPIIKLIE